MQHKNRLLRLSLFATCLVVLLILLSACVTAPRTSLASYVSVSSTGLSGKGTATLVVDWDAIKLDVLGGVPSGGTALEDYNKMATDLENSISFVLSQTSDLSNGDSVTVTIICNENASIAYNVRMYESFTVELDGFINQAEIDLFENLHISFVGFSPNVSIELRNLSENEFLKTVTYTTDKKEGLALGDEIVVTATFSQELADSLGYIPLSTVKTYKVDNVAYYPYSYSEYPADLVKELTTLSTEIVNNRWDDYYSVVLSVFGSSVDRNAYLEENVADIQIQTPELLEIFVLSRNDTSGSWFGSYNYLFFVYKTVINDSVLGKATDVYQCVVFSDIFVDETGAAVYSQVNTEKPQYETATIDQILVILQKDYQLYDREVILK
ncbi:MAG: hypothetical protein IJZ42_13530 [Lachnospiraceae bacterium]|nr:hypothetical protein [Lachnospiraceae bacterium]